MDHGNSSALDDRPGRETGLFPAISRIADWSLLPVSIGLVVAYLLEALSALSVALLPEVWQMTLPERWHILISAAAIVTAALLKALDRRP